MHDAGTDAGCEVRRSRRWVGLAALALVGCVAISGCQGGDSSPAAAPNGTPGSAGATTSGGGGAGGGDDVAAGNGDLARYAASVTKYAGQAGIAPRLLMAILYNESYKPHDPALERAWQKMKPDSAFGIANMHRAAFDEVKVGRDFANRNWDELPDHPDLAIEAAAWYLHDLGTQLPAQWPASLSREELLALGYNAGPGNMKAFARGTAPGSQAKSYLERLHGNEPAADKALRGH
ncbi:transglycosylase SLT domain-containing protein [Embleya sp. AB8]|uniref:transglycosylase SLT domain-containing protein n=1 Tax=Embleya sp. AB8 TaxID=3156304 RepID=UPI003C762916